MAASQTFSLIFKGGVASSLTGAISRLSGSTKALSRDLTGLNNVTSKIGQYRQMQSRLNDLRVKMEQGGQAGRRAGEQWRKMAGQLRELGGELQSAGVKLNKLGAAERKLARDTAKLNKQMGHLNRAAGFREMRQSAFAGWGGVVATGVAIGAPIREAIKFESKMADIKKVVNFDTPQQFKDMQKDILQLSMRIPMASDQIADIVAAAGQSGIARTELLRFAESAAKMGVAFDVSGAEAGQTMANWRASLKLNQDEVEDLADMVNHLSNNMNAQAPTLAGVIRRQGAVAKTAGLANNEIAALSAALLNSGASEEVAATALKNFTNAMTKGRNMSKSQRAAFRSLGFRNPDQLAKDMQTNARETITKVMRALSEAPEHKRGALVGAMFGEESKGAIMPLLTNFQKLEEAFDLVSDKSKYTGSMVKEFLERSKTTGNALDLLKNSVQAVAITFGNVLLPSLRKVITPLGDFLKKVMSLSEKYPELTGSIVGSVAGIFTAGAGFKVLSMGLKFVGGGLGEALSMLKFFNTALLASPIFWIVAGVVALGFALHKLGILKPLIKGFMGALKGVGGVLRNALKPGLDAFKKAVEPLGGIIKKFTGEINVSSWEAFGNLLGKVVVGAIKLFGEALSAQIEIMVSVGQFLGNLAGAVSIFAEDAIQWFTEAAKELGIFVQAVVNKGVEIYNDIQNTWKDIIEFLKKIDLKDLGIKIMKSLLSGIEAIAVKIKEKITGAFSIGGGEAEIQKLQQMDWSGVSAAPLASAEKPAGARAFGGPVIKGLAYLVGERGPELFVPNMSGRILPDFNRAKKSRFVPLLSSQAGGDPVSITINQTLNINGASGNPESIKAAVDQSMRENVAYIRRALERIRADGRRLSFA